MANRRRFPQFRGGNLPAGPQCTASSISGQYPIGQAGRLGPNEAVRSQVAPWTGPETCEVAQGAAPGRLEPPRASHGSSSTLGRMAMPPGALRRAARKNWLFRVLGVIRSNPGFFASPKRVEKTLTSRIWHLRLCSLSLMFQSIESHASGFALAGCSPIPDYRLSRLVRNVAWRSPVMAFKAIRNRDPSDCIDIPLPWKIAMVEEDREREHIRVQVRYVRGSEFHCPERGVRDQPVHDARSKVREDLRQGRHRFFIAVQVPRIRCGHCGALRLAFVPRARRGAA